MAASANLDHSTTTHVQPTQKEKDLVKHSQLDYRHYYNMVPAVRWNNVRYTITNKGLESTRVARGLWCYPSRHRHLQLVCSMLVWRDEGAVQVVWHHIVQVVESSVA